MNEKEFYKELYHKENERRLEVSNALNIPIAIISALATTLYLFVTSFDFKFNDILNYLFIGFISVTFLCLVLAIYFMIKAFSDFKKNYEYSGIPFVQELYNWKKELLVYYDYDQKKTDDDFDNYLTENLVKHIDHNMYVNDTKLRFIFNSKRYLVIGLILTLATSFVYGYNFFNKKDKIQKMIFVSSKDYINRIEENEIKIDSLEAVLKSINYEQTRKSTETKSETTTGKKAQSTDKTRTTKR